VIYQGELATLSAGSARLQIFHTLTRSQPPGWEGYARRIDGEMVAEVAWPRKDSPAVFICGPTAFVESAAGLLLESGYDATWIKTERFGATGG
jgi:ferredoxin-NADP reductase